MQAGGCKATNKLMQASNTYCIAAALSERDLSTSTLWANDHKEPTGILSMLVCVQRGHKILGGIPLGSTFCSKRSISIWNTKLAGAVGGKIWNSQNCSAGCLAPISPELAPKKVKSNNRGLGVYQLAQTGRAPLPRRLSIGRNPLGCSLLGF